MAFLDNLVPISDSDQPLHVFADDDHGMTGAAQLTQATPYLLPNKWGQAFGGLVQDQQYLL